jgi:hypothetical protein
VVDVSRYSRESLEHAIWRVTGRALTGRQVEAILAEADKYTQAYARELLPVYVRLLGPDQLRAILRGLEIAKDNRRSDAGRARKRVTS